MATTEATRAGAQREFRDELLRHGLLIATGVPGVYGRSGEFEDTVERVDRLVAAVGADDGAEVMRFPPIAQPGALRTERLPQVVSAPRRLGSQLRGERAGAPRAARRRSRTGSDWSAALAAAAVVLTPAACYPVYPLARGHLAAPAAGWSTSCRTASGTSRRTIPAGCRCSGCTSTCGRPTRRPSWRGARRGSTARSG